MVPAGKEWGLFIFFSCWIAIATVTVILFYPETKGVPLDQVGSLFSSHWYAALWLDTYVHMLMPCMLQIGRQSPGAIPGKCSVCAVFIFPSNAPLFSG